MLLLAGLNACRDSPKQPADDLSGYYYPVETIAGRGAMYIYKNLADTLGGREAWKLRAGGEGILLSENIDGTGRVLLRQRDRLVASGVLTDSLTLFAYDSTGARAMDVRVHAGNRLPFQVADTSSVYLTHLEWWQPGDSLHVVLQRRRQYDGDTVWTWQGHTLDAVRFTTRDQLETERDGWTTSSWDGEEIYAKGIGLVYYARHISPALRLAFTLERIE